jgi:hypothetical protein
MASDASNECFRFTGQRRPALDGAIEHKRRSHEPRSRSARVLERLGGLISAKAA